MVPRMASQVSESVRVSLHLERQEIFFTCALTRALYHVWTIPYTRRSQDRHSRGQEVFFTRGWVCVLYPISRLQESPLLYWDMPHD